ncbi:sulfotransferase [Mangrovimicrobium sediminis]|uniref:Sulfotransferase n=1 Tax=Mangrovimicrobium sediminis TaxID=2562682 RepID=A0A4Z0LUM8_9GAMM|nr:sulfotransferase [Haliea sp. SAOS-164]TGD71093.1 sulfotransferase [Haliea sp. SAOS-164]
MASMEDYLARASQRVGLGDFGDDAYQEGLQCLLAAAQSEARLSAAGQAAFDEMIIRALVNRLELEDWYQRHPEIDEGEIRRPLIGLGLPRTGSTVFSNMVAMDPAVRFLRSWEGPKPCPPPVRGEEDSDSRVQEMARNMEQSYRENPNLQKMLPSSPTSALECGIIMGYDFKSNFYSAMFHVPSYSRWLVEEADMVSAYRYLKRTLKLLQWRCPPDRWRLKSPPHSMFIEALDEVFPDAVFWMTHRDIRRVIPSVADLYYEHARRFSDHLDKHYLGRFNTEFWEQALHRMLAFRERGNDARFFDAYFDDIQQDPFATLERLYAFLGEEFTAETRDRIVQWRRETPRGKHGEHTYDAADYGIELGALGERFAFYSERFGLGGG